MKIKRIIISVVIIVFATTSKGENKMELTQRQQSLVEIASLAAKGDTLRLHQAIYNGCENNLTINELKEAFSHLYAYTGFPCVLNSLATMQQVLAERKQCGKVDITGREFTLAQNFDALKEGTKIQTKLCGGKPFNYIFDSRTDYYLKAHLFGDIYANPILSESDREIITISAIAALKGCEAQLLAHVQGSFNMGVTQQQLNDIEMIIQKKTGDIDAYRLRKAIATKDCKHFDEGLPVDFKIWPKGDLNTAYAKYFIGDSYLAPMDTEHGGPVNVTFEPKCRNNWHIHHNSVQVLICVAGRGWYQEYGKEAIEMIEGTVIAVPAGVKHWHGAAKDSWFQHLTYTTKVGENGSNEWLEPVEDSEYNKLL